MKNILLSSAAIVAFAGAAAAEVSWSGDAELGYNDDVEDGVYWEAGLGIDMSQELNNGFTVSASLDVDLRDDDAASGSSAFDLGTVSTSDWVLTLSNDAFALSAGDVDTAFASFNGVSEFYENEDEAAEYDATADAGILLTGTVGQFDLAVSSIVDTAGDLGANQLSVSGEFGAITAGLYYGQEDTSALTMQEELIALSIGAALGGADLTFNVGQFGGETGYGLEVAYPVGPVTLGAYFTSLDTETDDAFGISAAYSDGPIEAEVYYNDDFGSEEYGLGVTYDLGTGLVITAGYVDGDSITDDDFGAYVAAEYDLGGGASLLASYADAEVEGSDDIDTVTGGYELNDGATLALSFEF